MGDVHVPEIIVGSAAVGGMGSSCWDENSWEGTGDCLCIGTGGAIMAGDANTPAVFDDDKLISIGGGVLTPLLLPPLLVLPSIVEIVNPPPLPNPVAIDSSTGALVVAARCGPPTAPPLDAGVPV